MKKVLFLISLVMYFIFVPGYTPFPVEVRALAVLAIIQILWIGRVFPLAQGALLLMVILSFHFFTYEETLTYFASPIVWLLFSTFFISHAFIETGLAARISLKVLQLSGGESRLLILISYVLTILLSLVLPSNVGKGSLVASVFDGILKNMRPIADIKNVGRSMFIGLTYIVPISGALVATGASSTIYVFGILGEQGEQLTYLSWLIAFAPPVFLFAFFLWLLSITVFPPEKINRKSLVDVLRQKEKELGKLNVSEKKVLVIISVTLILWTTQPLHGISIPLIGLFGASLTMLPGIGVWTWEQGRQSVDWDMMLFFAATIMVSGMLIHTGTIRLVSNVLVNLLGGHSMILIILGMLTLTMCLRLIFVNILGLLTIVLPLSMAVGESLSSHAAENLAMAVFLAGVPGFLFITQSPVHLIAHSYQYFSEKDLVKLGIPATAIWGVMIVATAFLWW
ncbi:SLC13 family permease [Edaphobacillus lindanitolerans]|uniref:Sodium-dependent dicarboxylate transporter SdcS n=1 Tax=Edaphobacillus lindanitolerans TaxID=550447 RepID=A0A1U7PMU0_9BACI|nr:SLC13 family permease [Edaphobacillus lindanitolerans]SIT72482.1 anion transporter [Edaphobacillus lindanitolerans]